MIVENETIEDLKVLLNYWKKVAQKRLEEIESDKVMTAGLVTEIETLRATVQELKLIKKVT